VTGAAADRPSGKVGAVGEAPWQPRALAVDGDAVSRRFTELALGRAGFAVELAGSGAAALELLATQQVHLLLLDSELSDLNGLALVRRLRQERRLREVPVIFLSADRRPALRVAALQAGVEDVLQKPCDPDELAARCLAIVRRQRRQREERQHRGYTLAGDFHGLAFADLVSLLGGGRRSGVLSLASGDASGEIHFRDGAVVHASYGTIIGPEAFHRYLAVEGAQFEFTPGAPTVGAGSGEPVMALLMEGARRLDTARRDGEPMRPPMAAGAGAPGGVPDEALAPPLRPDPRLASRFRAVLRDPFALGELKLLEPRHLEAWTRSALGQARFHAHLVAEPADGVGAVLPLAGALTERVIIDALGAGTKTLGLGFFLRDERALDVVLVDAGDLSAAAPWLRRRPALLLVAPPEGDLLAFGTRGRATLAAHLRLQRPLVVLGCGRPDLATALAALCAAESPGSAVAFHPGALGREGCTLRELLVLGIDRWGALAPGADLPAGA
jgi:CheY-like chemotaxis protein